MLLSIKREVKFIEEYNNILTKDEKQNQYLLQFVKDYKNSILTAKNQ